MTTAQATPHSALAGPGADDPTILCQLAFGSLPDGTPVIRDLGHERFRTLLSLSQSHHVIMRAMVVLNEIFENAGDSRQEWAAAAIAEERVRIHRATSFLQTIVEVLTSAGCKVTVMKSLDHWPDLGSDLDLYTNADSREVIKVMAGQLEASVAPRSWGDRLANKWNFMVPGLPELVEIHMGRLGQTGELDGFAAALPARAALSSIPDCPVPVTSAEDRLIICTLQRMYRHFYIRLCDIVDTVQLLESRAVDYAALHSTAEENGVWAGVATFLAIVSDLAERWRGRAVEMPSWVRAEAQFGGDQITFSRGFLRVPILPHALRLYASQWAALITRRKFKNTARLSLLPWLATAASLGQTITGSDKGIW